MDYTTQYKVIIVNQVLQIMLNWIKMDLLKNTFESVVNFLLDDMFESHLKTFFQIYTDFDEIRKEIEAETERISGNNKVF